MANKEIDALTNADKLDGTEKVHVVQGANSRDTTAQDIANVGLVVEEVSGTTYAVVAGDHGKWKECTNGSPVTFNVEDGIMSAGDEVTLEQYGAGAVTVTPIGSMTIRSRDGRYVTNGQYACATLKFKSDSLATLVGDLT